MKYDQCQTIETSWSGIKKVYNLIMDMTWKLFELFFAKKVYLFGLKIEGNHKWKIVVQVLIFPYVNSNTFHNNLILKKIPLVNGSMLAFGTPLTEILLMHPANRFAFSAFHA